MTIPSMTFASKVGFTSAPANQKPKNQVSSKFPLTKDTIDFGARPPFYTLQILPPGPQKQARVRINKVIYDIKESHITFGNERVYFLFFPGSCKAVGIVARDSLLHPGDDYTVQFNRQPKVKLRMLVKL